MVRQAHHERNQYITVRPEPVEGLNQSFLNVMYCLNLIFHVALLRDCLFSIKKSVCFSFAPRCVSTLYLVLVQVALGDGGFLCCWLVSIGRAGTYA